MLSPAAVAIDLRWPNLFVVGVAKAGTTSLCAYLSQHPDIYMSAVKEPHFFSPPRPRVNPAIKDEPAYLALFAHAGSRRWRGDGSVSYFWDEETPRAIHRVAPDAAIVVSLRDPVERAYSHYWHSVKYDGEDRAFLSAIREELEHGADAEVAEGRGAYVDRGRYAERLHRYLDLFGDGVHVTFFEDIVRDDIAVMEELFRFLDVDPGVAGRLERDHRNGFSVPRNRTSSLLLGSRTARRVGRGLVPPPLRAAAEQALVRRTQKPPMPAAARELLAEIYAPQRDLLEALLRRPLPWPS